MSTDPLTEPEREVLHEKPRQFQLIHLMGITAALGVVSAIFAPAFRAIEAENAPTTLILIGIQLTVVTAAFFLGVYLRRKALRRSGARLGQSYIGSPLFQKLLSVFLIGSMLLLCLFIVLLTFQIPPGEAQKYPLMMVFQNFIIVLLSVPFLLHIFWRRHLGVVEFFEHGIAMSPFKFTPWELVDVQQHETKENGIQLTVATKGKFTRNLTVPALVSPALHSYLLKHHGEEQVDESTKQEVS